MHPIIEAPDMVEGLGYAAGGDRRERSRIRSDGAAL